MTLPNSIKDREHARFRQGPSKDKTKVAVINEQGPYNPVPVSLVSEDSFGRVKTAPPYLLFDSSFQYSLQTKVFIQSVLSGASITHDSARCSARIQASNTVGSRARFRSRNYFPYSPAFTNTVTASFNFHGIESGIVKRIGMYDEKNGYILEASNGSLRVGIRSSISGAPVTTYVNQVDWNVDKMDGSGDELTNPSGVLLDPSKQLILSISYQWLGSGMVQFSIIEGANIRVIHRFFHSNILTSLYSQTGTLPVQAEIINESGVSSYFEFTCCSVVSNGANAQHGHLNTISNQSSPKNMPNINVAYPVISLRKKAGFTNVPVQILDMSAFSTSQDDFLVQIVHKPTLIGAVWTDIPNSLCQKDVAATSYTGGDIVAQFYMKGNLQASEKLEALSKFWDLTLGDDFSGNSEIMSMIGIPLTTNALLYGVISFKEFE
jgi:hypothetical protein